MGTYIHAYHYPFWQNILKRDAINACEQEIFHNGFQGKNQKE